MFSMALYHTSFGDVRKEDNKLGQSLMQCYSSEDSFVVCGVVIELQAALCFDTCTPFRLGYVLRFSISTVLFQTRVQLPINSLLQSVRKDIHTAPCFHVSTVPISAFQLKYLIGFKLGLHTASPQLIDDSSYRLNIFVTPNVT